MRLSTKNAKNRNDRRNDVVARRNEFCLFFLCCRNKVSTPLLGADDDIGISRWNGVILSTTLAIPHLSCGISPRLPREWLLEAALPSLLSNRSVPSDDTPPWSDFKSRSFAMQGSSWLLTASVSEDGKFLPFCVFPDSEWTSHLMPIAFGNLMSIYSIYPYMILEASVSQTQQPCRSFYNALYQGCAWAFRDDFRYSETREHTSWEASCREGPKLNRCNATQYVLSYPNDRETVHWYQQLTGYVDPKMRLRISSASPTPHEARRASPSASPILSQTRRITKI